MAEELFSTPLATGCAACHSTAGSQKLLECLHVSCVECLRANVRDDGTVACPATGCDVITRLPSSSCFMGLESLPNNHLAAKSRPPSTLCDECPFDDTRSAAKKCLDCGILLCSFHVQYHAKSRRTMHHLLSEDLLEPSKSTLFCRLHPSGQLMVYCINCARLLCRRCLDLGVHKAHTHVPIGGAAAYKRIKLKQLLARSTMQSGDVIGKSREYLERIGENLQKVDESAEALSRIIAKKKEEFVALLKEDEDRNIAAVDTIRWRKRQVLEIEEQKLKECLTTNERAVGFSQESATSLSDIELLDLADVLERSLMTVKKRCYTLTEALACTEQRNPDLTSPDISFSPTWDRIQPGVGHLGRPGESAGRAGDYNSAFLFHFDKDNCGENIAISECGLKATCTGETTSGVAVVGSVGFSSGVDHQWSMLLDVKPPGYYTRTIHIGVTDEPCQLDSKRSWVWRTSGSHRSKGASKWEDLPDMSPWKTGTVLEVNVQFSTSNVTVILNPSNSDFLFPLEIEKKVIHGPLYPFFYINHGQSVTLLPHTQK